MKMDWNGLSKEMTMPAKKYASRRHLSLELLQNSPHVRYGELSVTRHDASKKEFKTPVLSSLLISQKTLEPVGFQSAHFNDRGLTLKEEGISKNYKFCSKFITGLWPVMSIVRSPVGQDLIHVGEGLETVAAVGGCIPKGGVISTFSADSLEKFSLPEKWRSQIKTICIWADFDAKSGTGATVAMNAAQRLRFEGHNVIIMHPNYGTESCDWADIIKNEKIMALPLEQRRDALMRFAQVGKQPAIEVNPVVEAPIATPATIHNTGPAPVTQNVHYANDTVGSYHEQDEYQTDQSDIEAYYAHAG